MDQAGAAASQYPVSDSTAAHHAAAEAGVFSTSPVPTAPAAPLEPDTTPDGEPIQAGLLGLDVTPPFNISSRQQHRCFARGGRGAATDGGHPGDNGDVAFQWPDKQLPRQKEPMPALPHAEPGALSSRFAQNLGVERRQLVFGGRDGGADRPECGDDYDSQPLGSEDASTGAIGVAVGAGPSGPLAPWDRCGQERVRLFSPSRMPAAAAKIDVEKPWHDNSGHCSSGRHQL